ncbi:MAG: hypothetical protein ACRENK_01690, partial [Gemmatimonadaceae bacterium]
PAADPDEVLAREFASENYFDIQKADFVKLRDLSLSYDLPPAMVARFADHATLMLAGHNLRTWTKYGGADPELNFNGGVSTFNRNDSWTLPPTRNYTFSVAVGF